MSYIKPQITPPSPLIFAILNGGSKWRVNSAHLGSPLGKPAENTHHLTWRVGGGGTLGWGLVWLIFLLTYMTSGPCSSWFFLVMKSWFFWYYLGLQVMAILCRAAKNSLRGTRRKKINLKYRMTNNAWIPRIGVIFPRIQNGSVQLQYLL